MNRNSQIANDRSCSVTSIHSNTSTIAAAS
jgi:hypothetical protein